MEIRAVPFIAMGGVYEEDDIEATRRVTAAVAAGGSFFPLPEENDFQNALGEHEGAARAIAVNSCGTALDCCMMALGIGPGDEVITTPLTFVCTAGTAEEHILQVLDRRLNLFELVVGEVDMVLGELEDEREFADRVYDIYSGSQTDDDVENGFDELGRLLATAHDRMDRARAADEALFGDAFGV